MEIQRASWSCWSPANPGNNSSMQSPTESVDLHQPSGRLPLGGLWRSYWLRLCTLRYLLRRIREHDDWLHYDYATSNAGEPVGE